MKKTGAYLKILIVVLWVVMAGMLIKRQFLASDPIRFDEHYLDTFIESREEWAGIYLMGKKVGYAHSAIRKAEGGYQISEDLFMDMTVMDVPQRIETQINALTESDLKLSVFSFRLKSGIISFIAYGSVEGNTLTVRINAAGTKRSQSFELTDVPVLTNGLKYYLLKQGLAPGSTYQHTFFDPLTLSTRSIMVEVVGREQIEIRGTRYESYKIKESFGGVALNAWIGPNGETLKEESPMGLVLIREDKDEALHAYWSDKPDILAASAIDVDSAFSKAGLSFLNVRLKNVDLSFFNLDGGRQTHSGDVVAIRLENITDGDTYQVPWTGEGLDRYVAATPFMQSDAQDIKMLARIISGEKKDAQTIVRKMVKWVYQNIEKKPTLSIPSAVEVLKAKQGDCNEHAILLAALCRAQGIPTKLRAGLVYVNGKFYYHAWVEVYLNTWVSADPTLNQFPADVTHISFVEGDLESQIKILGLVGKLDIDILEHS